MNVALLAERLRVEERQIAEAFKAKGLSSELIKPASLSVNLNDAVAPVADLVLDRAVTTRDTSSLLTLLGSNNVTIVNRPATSRLLADRMALIRHLIIAGLPVPQTRIAFGEESALIAIDELGYPVVIKTLDVRPGFPSAFVDDRDSAEAIVEHRNVLGHDQTTLIQGFQRSLHDRSLRAVVIGSEVVAFDARPHDGWRPDPNGDYINTTPDEIGSDVKALAEAVISRVGTGVYAVLIIETSAGPIVTGLENLVTFRHLADQGIDPSSMIVDFSLSQVPATQTR
jgi:[lysine-biosynthesis-protein LysW]---L-2-aminoadipate ligase